MSSTDGALPAGTKLCPQDGARLLFETAHGFTLARVQKDGGLLISAKCEQCGKLFKVVTHG